MYRYVERKVCRYRYPCTGIKFLPLHGDSSLSRVLCTGRKKSLQLPVSLHGDKVPTGIPDVAARGQLIVTSSMYRYVERKVCRYRYPCTGIKFLPLHGDSSLSRVLCTGRKKSLQLPVSLHGDKVPTGIPDVAARGQLIVTSSMYR